MIFDISFWEISMPIKGKRQIVEDTSSGFINFLLQSMSYHIKEITPELTEYQFTLNRKSTTI